MVTCTKPTSDDGGQPYALTPDDEHEPMCYRLGHLFMLSHTPRPLLLCLPALLFSCFALASAATWLFYLDMR